MTDQAFSPPEPSSSFVKQTTRPVPGSSSTVPGTRPSYRSSLPSNARNGISAHGLYQCGRLAYTLICFWLMPGLVSPAAWTNGPSTGLIWQASSPFSTSALTQTATPHLTTLSRLIFSKRCCRPGPPVLTFSHSHSRL